MRAQTSPRPLHNVQNGGRWEAMEEDTGLHVGDNGSHDSGQPRDLFFGLQNCFR